MSKPSDPWERRDAERARFRSKQGEPRDLFDELQRSQRPLGLVLCLAVLLAAEVSLLAPTIRLFLSIGGVVGLLLLLVSCRDYGEPLARFVRRGPTLAWFACLLWGGVSFFLAPNRTVATGEAIRLLAGATAFLVAAYALRDRRELGLALGGILALACGISLYDIAHFAQKVGLSTHFTADNISILGTHESVGSLLALLLPLALGLGLSGVLSERARLSAQAVTLILGFAWIMVRCRSAWLGGGIALLVLGYLYWRFPLTREKKNKSGARGWKSALTSPVVVVIGALVAMALLGGLAPLLSNRAAALVNPLEDSSLSGRLIMWNGALRMLSQRPWLGWGLGSYLLLQGRWTNLGDGPEHVALYGTGHQNIAHNYYVQWAAETGGIGLFLFLFSVLVLLGSGWYALARVRDPWERTLLMACGAALLGGLIEVAGSPAFQFCGVWAVFWSVAGVFVAVIRLAGAEPEPRRERRGYVVAAVIAAVLCGGALWLGNRLWDPRGQPRGIFQLLEQTHGPYAPGETVRWRATYRNGWGKEQGSASATTWLTPIWYERGRVAAPRLIQSQEWALMREPFNHSDPLRGFSEFSLRLPAGETGMVQVQAVFQDEFGRTYGGSRVADVVKPLPGVKKPSTKSLPH